MDKLIYTDKQKALEFYDSLEGFPFYICGGDCNNDNLKLVEVVDNLVFYKDEYYLPAPQSSHANAFGKRDKVQDGFYHAFIVNRVVVTKYKKSKRDTDKVSLLSEIPEESETYKVFYPYRAVETEYKNVEIDEFYIRPYDSSVCGLSMEYSQSGRHGLSIEVVEIDNMERFFVEHFCREQFARRVQYFYPSRELIFHLHEIKDKLNELFRYSDSRDIYGCNYDIEDGESYGEYSLHYIKLNKSGSRAVSRLVNNTVNSFTGKKCKDSPL